MSKYKWLVPTLYIFFLMIPIYWLVNMSFKNTSEIINSFSIHPHGPSLIEYHVPSLHFGFTSSKLHSHIFLRDNRCTILKHNEIIIRYFIY